jgi:solute:Na+ symporter, SSS family
LFVQRIWRALIDRIRRTEPTLPQLASSDWLIVVLYVLGVVCMGVGMRSSIKTSRDYFQAGRSLPAWVCALAFIGASAGAQEVIGMGAAGAGFGFRAALYFFLGNVPALLFVALFVMPLYYGSGAITLPGYLGMRFDAKTRVLSAGLFVAMALASAGIALFMVARIFQALRIFDSLFFAYGWPREGIFLICILMAAVPVLVYVMIAGLRGTIVGQVLQFLLLIAGLLPVVWAGLKNVGGWSGLQASLIPLMPEPITSIGPAGVAAIALVLGFVLGLARWTTDFRVLQMAMAAKNADAARRIPIIAAAARLAIPFLLVLSGAIAISLPTPQTKTIVRNQNGEIYHEINIVPKAISEGHGLVPALIDPATNNARVDNAGHALLDYGMATPNLLTHFAASGLLGLSIAALLGILMSGVSSNVMAVSTVFACDLYQPLLKKLPSDENLLRAARLAAAVGLLLSVGAAFAIAAFSGKSSATVISAWLVALLLVFTLLQAPQMATFFVGVFTRRATGNGAFAGLLAGLIAAMLHYGLTLPANAQPGLQGGWLSVVHHYPGVLAQAGFTVAFSFAANLAVAWGVSRDTGGRPKAELKNLVYAPLTSKPSKTGQKRPETLAIIVMLITLVLALVFA